MRTKSSGYCKVYYSLLALCYFEVLLWTFCLLASCAAPVHGHSYLIRETQTLKFATRTAVRPIVFKQHLRLQPKLLWEDRSVSVRKEQVDINPRVDESGLSWLRGGFPVSTGLPAPWTGIKAIS